jgi:hypothetical protein
LFNRARLKGNDLMRTARSYRPRVEELESIALLSVGGTGPASALVSASRHPSSHHHLLGSASGTWTAQPGIPDVGETQNLVGNGKLHGLGEVQVQGSLHLTGFIRFGNAEGTLTLTNPHGSVTLALTGPTQPGFSGPPQSFTFTIASGTGCYQGWQDSGQLNFRNRSRVDGETRTAGIEPRSYFPDASVDPTNGTSLSANSDRA